MHFYAEIQDGRHKQQENVQVSHIISEIHAVSSCNLYMLHIYQLNTVF